MGVLILVVEDEINISQVLQEILKLEGFDVDAAFDGEEAIAKAHSVVPKIILLDIGLPKKNGFEVLESLKADPRTQMIPVVILSAWNQDDYIQKGLSLGAAKYMTKPFDPFAVVTAVKEVLGAA